MYTLDTNAIIYYQKDEPSVVKVLQPLFAQPGLFFVSTVSELELFSFAPLSQHEIDRIGRILAALTIVVLDSTIARIAGELRRRFELKLPDSAIAATSLETGSVLITRNVRDFQRVPNLELLKI